MKLTSDKAIGSALSEKPRSSRVKKSHFQKWKDYDVEFHNSPKIRNRKRAPLIRDSDEQFDDLSERKRSKKSVSLSDDDSLSLKFPNEAQIPEQKPFILNYDLAIPKRPRCVSKQNRINTFTNNSILPFKKRKQEEFNYPKEGKIVNSHIDNPQNSRFLTPNRQFENEITKKRRRFYEVSIKDVDPFWIVKQRIRVFWPLDKSWYFGTVKEYDSKSKGHYIKYDDHEEEWVDLKNERFKLLLYPSEVLNGEDSELEIKMENDPIVSWISCKSRKWNNNNSNTNYNNILSPPTSSVGEKNFNLVYFRKRFHNEGEKLVKLEFYIPIKGINFHFWLNRLPLFASHGKNKIVRVSQTVQLEMVLIDNLLGLRIFNFEGYLNQTIDILCFLISRFCPKKIIRKNTGAKMKMKNKIPCASAGVKISTTSHDNKKRELYFLTYRFHELGTLRYGLVEKYLRSKNCSKLKDLSVENLMHFNARKISFAKDLLWPSFCKGSNEDLIYQNANIFKLDPEIVYIYESSKWRSFHPSLFINKHLKFLMDKNTLTSQIHKKPNYSISSWDKTDRNSVSPTSVLSNDQNTPRSKKPRTLVSYSKETHNPNPNPNSDIKNKTHYRKKHSWKQLNTSIEISQVPYTKNVRAKTIPTPGAHLMRGPNEDFSHFERPVKYHKEIGTEIERCMDPVHVVYDMDSDDEKWVRKYNNGFNKLTDDIFERVIDSFEKFAYVKKGDELSLSELEELDCFGGGFNVIHDVYEYWIQKRKERNNLPLIRQFQPPLWEVYQKQVRDWQLSFNRFRASSAENPSNQKPALFAFCLKPKGLVDSCNIYNNNIIINKDSKQKSHKKLAPHFPSLDSALTAFAKRSNEASFSPRTPRTGGVTGLADGRIRHHHNGIHIGKSKWSSPVGSELEEFKSRDASCAAFHVANLARLKREKALAMLQKAELAMYKASCAVLIADCIKKSQK